MHQQLQTRRGIDPNRQHATQKHHISKPRFKLRNVTYPTNATDRHFSSSVSEHTYHSKCVERFAATDVIIPSNTNATLPKTYPPISDRSPNQNGLVFAIPYRKKNAKAPKKHT